MMFSYTCLAAVALAAMIYLGWQVETWCEVRTPPMPLEPPPPKPCTYTAVNEAAGVKIATAQPTGRVLVQDSALPKSYRCLLFIGDSIGLPSGQSRVGYPEHTKSMLEAAGHNGEIRVMLRPGQGATDWMKTGMVEEAVERSVNCSGAVIQLGVNDYHKQVTVAEFIHVMRRLVGSLREARGYENFQITMLTIMPCTMFKEYSTEWMLNANTAIAELAYLYTARVADTHWALLNAWRQGGSGSWEELLDDNACHPTPYGKHLMAKLIAATILGRGGVYFMSATCGKEIKWLGHFIRPVWPNGPMACHSNPRLVVVLRNDTELFFSNLPVNITLSLPWQEVFRRLVPYGTYWYHLTYVSSPPTLTKFYAPMGGGEVPLSIPAGSATFRISLRKAFTKSTNFGNKKLAQWSRQTGPAADVQLNGKKSLAEALKLWEGLPEFNNTSNN